MTRQVANTVVQTDTFAGWVEKTNELATHMRESVVTTALNGNSHVEGANTVGNAFVVGVFGASAFAMSTDSNSDAFIRAIQNGESDSANTSGNIVFQSDTNFNANVFANAVTVDIEGNVVSNGTSFSVTTTGNTDIESANVVIKATSTGTINVAALFVEGTTTNVSSNVNIKGVNLFVSANVDIECGDILIGNTTSTGLVNVATQDFNTSANVDITGTNLNVSAVADFSANVIVNANDFVVDTTNQRVGIGTATPSTMVHVTGSGAQTVTIEGGSANVLIVANNQSNFYGSQNVVIKTAQSKHIKFHANGQTAAAVSAMLAANGNFGIGNTTPAQKLVVAGSANISGTATMADINAQDIVANSISINSGNGSFIDIDAEDIGANSLTLSNTAALADVTATSMNATSLGLTGGLKVGGSINHANDVYTSVSSMTTNNDSDTEENILVFAHATYQSARITVSGRYASAGATEVQVTEALVVTDGTDVFMTTFGTISTDAGNDFSVFTIDAEIDGANVNITANHANTAVSNTKLITSSQLYRIQ